MIEVVSQISGGGLDYLIEDTGKLTYHLDK